MHSHLSYPQFSMVARILSSALSLLLPLTASLPVTLEAKETPIEEPLFLASIGSLPRSGRTQRMSQEKRNIRRVISHAERLRELRTLRRVAHKKTVSATVSLKRLLIRSEKFQKVMEQQRQERRRLLAKTMRMGKRGRRALAQDVRDQITKKSCSFSHPKGYISPCLTFVRPETETRAKTEKQSLLPTKAILKEQGPKRRFSPVTTRRSRTRETPRSTQATFERQRNERMQTLEKLRKDTLEKQWRPHFEWDR